MAGLPLRESPGRKLTGDSSPVWVVPGTDEGSIRGVQDSAGVSRLVARVLAARKLTLPGDVAKFTRCSISDLSAPSLLSGMEEAAGRIAGAIEKREKITIFGDYDVDGITATALMRGALKRLGASPGVYIPHRTIEGYGPNPDAMREIVQSGAGLVITVDCGVKAVAEADILREAGVDLVITDHHHAGDELPHACAIVNPRMSPDFPTKDIAGVAVAFYLAWALGDRIFGKGNIGPRYREYLTNSIELVALGTIADVVPLLGENRLLAGYGLKKMARSGIPGIRALIEVARLRDKELGAMNVAFGLAPRINAAGRIGHALQALDLLNTEDDTEASEVAQFLDATNRKRQRIEDKILGELLEKLPEETPPHAIVSAHDGWHAGVIGIVASRVCEKFNRPAALVSFQNGDAGRGSARSPQGFDLYAALSEVAGHFESFGGHEYAAGFAIRRENYGAFRRDFEEVSARMIAENPPRPLLHTDGVFPPEELTLENVSDLSMLEPYGEGNPEPVGVMTDVAPVGNVRLMGSTQKHISFMAKAGGRMFRVVGFGKVDKVSLIESGSRLEMAVRPDLNTFRGETNVELYLQAVRPAGGRRKRNTGTEGD